MTGIEEEFISNNQKNILGLSNEEVLKRKEDGKVIIFLRLRQEPYGK